MEKNEGQKTAQSVLDLESPMLYDIRENPEENTVKQKKNIGQVKEGKHKSFTQK